MKKVHFFLNGKGGVGKSTKASFFIQYLKSFSTALGIDCDASNSTLSGYKALNIKQIKITSNDDNNTIDKSKFDNVMEQILTSDAEHVVIDSGASSFLSQMAYMVKTDTFILLGENNFQVHIHLAIAGGDMIKDSFISVKNILKQIQGDIIYHIWLNEYFGSFINKDIHFIDTQYFKEIKPKITSTIILEKQDSDLVGKDIKKMLMNQLTFDEINTDENFSIFQKSRLKKFKEELFNNIQQNLLIG